MSRKSRSAEQAAERARGRDMPRVLGGTMIPPDEPPAATGGEDERGDRRGEQSSGVQRDRPAAEGWEAEGEVRWSVDAFMTHF